jgi:hypothetical protein
MTTQQLLRLMWLLIYCQLSSGTSTDISLFGSTFTTLFIIGLVVIIILIHFGFFQPFALCHPHTQLTENELIYAIFVSLSF